MATAPTPTRFTAGRYLKAVAVAKGNLPGAVVFAESQGQWADRQQVVSSLKAAVAAMGTADAPGDTGPVAESFLAAMRPYSVPLRLSGFKAVPTFTRIFVSSSGVIAARVAEGSAIPVLRGDWTATTLEPIKHAGIVVQTDELVRSMSPAAAAAFVDDLAQATAEAENRSFASPEEVGSVLYGAPSFSATGATVADIDADLRRLVDSVAGASKPGAAFLMTRESATYLSLVRGTGGAAAYPNITPQGGTLIGMPVIVTAACAVAGSPPTRVIGLISPSEIFWADEGGVTLSASAEALLEMSDTPSGNSLTPAATTLVSMFQAGATALRAVRESAWYARAGSGAYFVAGY